MLRFAIPFKTVFFYLRRTSEPTSRTRSPERRNGGDPLSSDRRRLVIKSSTHLRQLQLKHAGTATGTMVHVWTGTWRATGGRRSG